MTETTDKNNLEGEMNPRYADLPAYALNALDTDEERRAVEALIESDNVALNELNEFTETTSLLAAAVPQVAPPAHLKQSILALAADESTQTENVIQFEPNPVATPPWWQRMFQSGLATSAAAAVLVIVVGSVLGYQNSQLSSEIDTLRNDLAAESVLVANLQSELSSTLVDSENRVASMKSEMEHMESEFGATTEMVVHQEEMVSELAIANEALRQALRDQSWLTYVAMKEGYQVESWLASNTQQVTSQEQNASGLIAVRVVGNEAVFQVHGLPQPQPGMVYTLWLTGNGDPVPVAQFDVSEIGSATVAFLLPAPLHFFSSAMVTQERSDGVANDPTGTMIMSADTK